MEKCVRCGVDDEKGRLFDAICDGRVEGICGVCARMWNVPVIKKPEVSQLRGAEKGFAVYKRMRILSGIKDAEEEKSAKQKTKQAQAVSKEIYDRIQKDQELIDAEDDQGALKILNLIIKKNCLLPLVMYLRLLFKHQQEHYHLRMVLLLVKRYSQSVFYQL